MTLTRLVIKNSLRNKRRTGLTVLSIGFSLFLLIALWTFLDLLFNPPQNEESALRLAVQRSTSIVDQMPIAYLQKIKKVPHVALAMPLQWFGGVYREPKNMFANFAVDPKAFWQMFPELRTSDEAKRRFANERTAAVVGEDLASRYGWKVGDRVTLLGTIFPVDLEFEIVGIYNYEIQQNAFYFNFDYFNQALGDPSQVGAFWIKADSAAAIPGIADTIDKMFHNTAAETKTETEKAFILGFISMLGNVKMMVGSIAAVVIFTMLLVTGATMSMTIRERIREIAILKSMGFLRRTILALILGEAVLLAVLGFGMGCLLAYGLGKMDLDKMTQGFVPYFRPGMMIYGWALTTGILIGALSGLIPALHASSLTITAAMRRME